MVKLHYSRDRKTEVYISYTDTDNWEKEISLLSKQLLPLKLKNKIICIKHSDDEDIKNNVIRLVRKYLLIDINKYYSIK